MVQIKFWWKETCKFCRVIDQFTQVALRILVLFLSLYGGYLVIFWIQDNEPVVIFGMGEVTPSTGRPNDLLVFYLPFKKERNCWGIVQRFLIGGCGMFLLSESPSWIEAPWEGRLTYSVQIPHEAIPGPCGFQVIARFVCNPLDLFSNRLVASTPIQFQVLRYDQVDE